MLASASRVVTSLDHRSAGATPPSGRSSRLATRFVTEIPSFADTDALSKLLRSAASAAATTSASRRLTRS